MRLWLAIRVFLAILFDPRVAAKCERVLVPDADENGSDSAPTPAVEKAATEPATARSDAITLLAALQREARFVDIVKEPLGDYSNEQIGAAARDVLRDCGAVLDRLFAIAPLADQEEGAEWQTPDDLDAGGYRLTGDVSGDPPFRGRLAHHGWQAARCELPRWSGSEQSAMVVAPVELDLGSS